MDVISAFFKFSFLLFLFFFLFFFSSHTIQKRGTIYLLLSFILSLRMKRDARFSIVFFSPNWMLSFQSIWIRKKKKNRNEIENEGVRFLKNRKCKNGMERQNKIMRWLFEVVFKRLDLWLFKWKGEREIKRERERKNVTWRERERETWWGKRKIRGSEWMEVNRAAHFTAI